MRLGPGQLSILRPRASNCLESILGSLQSEWSWTNLRSASIHAPLLLFWLLTFVHRHWLRVCSDKRWVPPRTPAPLWLPTLRLFPDPTGSFWRMLMCHHTSTPCLMRHCISSYLCSFRELKMSNIHSFLQTLPYGIPWTLDTSNITSVESFKCALHNSDIHRLHMCDIFDIELYTLSCVLCLTYMYSVCFCSSLGSVQD